MEGARVEMTVDGSSMELIRRQTLERAANDLRRAAGQLEDLSQAAWPPLNRDVEDARTSVALVRASLVVIDQVGWPREATERRRCLRQPHRPDSRQDPPGPARIA
jgi:hypothetical protein